MYERLIVTSAFLLVLSMLAYWTMPDNVGLGAMYYMVRNTILLAPLGLVALAIALWRRWLPRDFAWVMRGLAAWVIVPIVAGPIVAGIALLLLYGFYTSPPVTILNARYFGVAITAQAPRFEYAGCRRTAYIATYAIKAERDTDLVFALASRNDVDWFDARKGPIESIAAQFQPLGDGPYMHGTPQGLFRIPAGEHTLVVRGPAPFQLAVHPTAPLWTPDLFLAGNDYYATLYEDNHTWRELDALAQRFQGAGCTRECSRADIPAPGTRGLAAVDDSAAIGPVTGERPVDTGGDGRFDTLTLTVTLAVTTTGDYQLGGWLTTADGQQLAGASYASDHSRPLCAGVHAVPLSFDGRSLYRAAIEGPYTLSDLALIYNSAPDTSVPPTIDEADSWYTTTAYTWRQFESDGHTPTASGSRAEDITGNGLYDFLAVDVQFRDLVPGDYQWLGLLQGAGGCHAADVQREGRLDGNTPATFYFTGGRIRSGGCDGPYTLTNVYLVGIGDQVTTSYFDNLHTTAPYKATEFDTTPIVFGSFDLGYFDPDNDDVRNSLVISATVAAIDRNTQEQHDWSGSLTAPDGALIETVTGRSQLYVGKTIVFDFSGAAISAAGSDGPYTLRNITISQQSVPTQTVVPAALYTTPALKASDFEP
jgi:hypothetical protein